MFLPVPEKPLLVVAAWPDADLGPNAPLVWRQARADNQPLPTLMGYARNPQDGQPVPFAVVFPSLFSSETYKTGKWILVAETELGAKKAVSMSQAFGSAWKLPWHDDISLTVYAQEMLDPEGVSQNLPQTISGPVMGNVWRTDFAVDADMASKLQDLKKIQTQGMALSQESAKIISSFAGLNGVVWPVPSFGQLDWSNAASGTVFGLAAPSGQKAIVGLSMAVANGKNGLKNAMLEDQTPYQIITPPAVAATDTPGSVSIKSGWGLANGEGSLEVECQGNDILSLDSRSMSSACMWLGLCWEKPKGVKMSVENGKLTVCF